MNTITGLNRLKNEKSPYLLQHKDNPVWWYPWGNEAFEAARAANKPVFLSIGYSTCYWCHVMEKDSFETEDVAAVLNEHFISIKLDREERPDIDAIYMDAVVGMTGHGGWPMSVFLTPDRKPFYGGTFFYQAQFINILEQLARAWSTQPEKIESSSEEITKFLQGRVEVPAHEGETASTDTLLTEFTAESERRFDHHFGGFGPAPKFPPTGPLAVLLRAAHRLGSEPAKKMALFTLDAMARGGLYDQVGGGFSRYSTDEKWLVPHFEKMLYDNALLTVNYLEAFQLSRREAYLDIARETLDYVLREMTSPEGGFYSAQDAGEVGEEGDYYVWSHRGLRDLLPPEEFAAVEKAYQVTVEGNFEAKHTVLALSADRPLEDRSEPALVRARAVMFKTRESREKPRRDDKILTSWNGLMISAFALGAAVTGEERYRAAAERAAAFIGEKLSSGDTVLRRYCDGEAALPGTLEDYVYLVQGLIDLYEATFDERHILRARELQHAQDGRFWDAGKGGYFYSQEPDAIVHRKEYLDNATPSPNALALSNLYRLTLFFSDDKLRERARELEKQFEPFVQKYPTAVARCIAALDRAPERSIELVLAVPSGGEAELHAAAKSLAAEFYPHLTRGAAVDGSESGVMLCSSKPIRDGEPTFYLCRDRRCDAPLNDLKAVRDAINTKSD